VPSPIVVPRTSIATSTVIEAATVVDIEARSERNASATTIRKRLIPAPGAGRAGASAP